MLRRLLGLLALVVLVALVGIGVAAYWLLSGDGVRRALETQATAWLGQKVEIGAASIGVVPRVAIQLSDVRVGDPTRVTLAQVDVSAPLRALLERRIEDADVAITRSRIELPLPFAMPSQDRTNATDTAAASGDSSPAVRLVSVRSIRLRDVTIVSRRRELTVSADASLATTDGASQASPGASTLTLTRLSAASGATALEANGAVALEPRLDAQLRVTANRLDLDDLIALANAFSPPPSRETSKSARPDARIAARISAAAVRAGGLDARNFACELQVVGDAVTLSPMSVDLFGGRYQGSLNARLSDAIAATLRSRVTDLDVAQLAAFGGVAGAISGRLSGAATFAGTGTDFAGVLRTARGSGTASISNGTIEHLDLVRTVVQFFGRPSAERGTATDRFDRLDAQFSLAQQLLKAEALSLHSPDADLVGQGSLALTTKALDGRADISLSESLSHVAGTDLYRYTHEGNRIVLPATIGGTLGSPRIGIDARAAVGRGLRNELQQRLGGLLDRLNSPQ